MINKCELKLMTWKEIEAAFHENPVVILPLGSMEVHGPHSPVGDFIAAEIVATRAAEQTGAYVVPVVPFGDSEYFRGFPGTISVRHDTLMSWVSDVCESLFEHGVKKLLFLNGHAGNTPALEQLSRRFRREKGLIVPRMDLWQMAPARVKEAAFGPDYQTTGHGGGSVDCVMQYLFPEAMRMDLYDESESRCEMWQAFSLNGLGKTKINGMPAFLPTNMEDISQQGTLGAPKLGNPGGGETLVNWYVDCLREFIEKMKHSDMALAEQ